ncbi:MAG: ATP-binding protein [Gammaproteobacteria bacterium]|nr:ATP-binding protein [Gammaproteobacteria bacterium]MYE50256.1 ATP-binding protein [Gammaproteobacteria bacterium]MYF51644.1 ATP-binding protein [Gammaproteobacteria bacterium]
MTEELESARDRVLVDNTAQAVFKHLDRIWDNRGALGARWIWELFQNARDAAGRRGVRIQARVSGTEFRFEHDGKPFASEEIAHLVYHGSTKINDFEDIGQFGSGFLATHLLSRTIRVTGRLDDLNEFDFPLDRTGGTAEELRQAMDRSWAAFKESGKETPSGSEATTSFAYEISEAKARELAESGLEELRRNGPLVLAFCPEIAEIAVETASAEWVLSRESQEDGGVLTFRHLGDGTEVSRFVAVAGAEGDCCAALQLRRGDSGLEIDQEQETAAKLFVLFPLVGSEQLGLPATVNSRQFKPREDRDGIVSGDSTGAQENRRLLEASVRHQEQLFDWCAQQKWAGAERMLAFDTGHLPDWAGSTPWFRPVLTTLVHKARTTALLRSVGGEWVEPQAAWLPTTKDTSNRERLWRLMMSWKGAEAKLPRFDDLASWSRNLSGWQRLLGKSQEDMEEALTIARVARLVGNSGTLVGLRGRLAHGEGLSWLVSLLELVRDADETGLFDGHHLLPTQGGRLRRRPDIRRDEGISEELKNIAEAFGLEIRDELLDRGAELEGLADLLPSKREPELLDEVLARVKDECREGAIRTPLALSTVRLFEWMADRPNYVERLEGFPVPTCERSHESVTVVHLERGREAPARPLAPLATWPEMAQRFGSLFPRRRVLAEDFADSDPEVWTRVAESGFLNASPLIKTRRVVDAFLPDEPLPEVDGGAGSHKSTQDVEVTDIACLVESDIGLIDTARKSRKRATELVRFLVEFAAEADGHAFEVCEVECECGVSHRTYCGAWLTPLRRRRWVPLDASGRRGTTATAESLAGLLADSPNTSEVLSGVRGEKLLDALGISRADLALRIVAGDEDKRLALIASMQDLAAAAGDVRRVRELATEIREHPDIIASIEERKIRRNKIRHNQEIGSLVEELLRQELEGHGLTVRRTGVGSDFEVENDFVEDEQEVGLELSGGLGTTLIEVKSTRIDQVKMTPVQATRACSLGEGFALCVVPLGEDAPTGETIRTGLRVVFGIGERLKSALSDYEFLQEAADAAREPRGAVELEVSEGEARFRIGHTLWEDGLPFEQAVDRFRSCG